MKIEQIIKKATIEKYFGIVLVVFSLVSFCFFIKTNVEDIVPNSIVFLLSLIIGLFFWIPAEDNKKGYYSLYKQGLSILFLLKETNYKISEEHCYQIIKNTNQKLNYEFLPDLEEFKNINYTPILKAWTNRLFVKIKNPNSDSDKSFLFFLEYNDDFLKNNEKQILKEKLSFYNY